MANYALETSHPVVEPGLTVSDLGKVLGRRRNVGLAILGACVLLTLLYCLVATRKFTASGTVQVAKEGATAIDVSDFTGGAAPGGYDVSASNVNIETQVQILQSETLALRVIKELNLENTTDFQHHWNPVGAVLELVTPKVNEDAAGKPIEDSPARRTRAVKIFEKNLTVKALTGTRLVQVDYTNSDPKLAAVVVNRLIQDLTDFSYETKNASTLEASSFLQSQLDTLRKKSEADQAKLSEMQKNADLFSFGTDSTGHEQLYSDRLDKLQQSTAALSVATQNRIQKQAVYNAVKSGNAELISELSGVTGGVGIGAVAGSLNLIQNLRLQQSTLEQQIADGEQKYGPAYPRMTELHAQLDKVNKSLNDEIGRVAARSKNDYDVALVSEQQLKAQNAANHRGADELKDKAVDYTIMREEANQSRSLYEDMLKKINESGAIQGLKGSDVSVVDPGRTPASASKPNTPLFLAIALAVGLLFGFGGMLVAEGLDRSVHTTSQIERLGMPLIGILPKYGADMAPLDAIRDLRVLNAPKSAYSEAVRGVRSSLISPGLLGEHRAIVVTSPGGDEGNSLTARNLAVSVAQQGKRVVLVDANFRAFSGASKEFSAKDGLSSLLGGPSGTSGTPPGAQRSEPLHSSHRHPPEQSIGAPQLSAAEAPHRRVQAAIRRRPHRRSARPSVVDSLLLAELSDSVLLVARHGVTDEASLERAFQLLASRTKPDSVAVVLTGVSTKSDIYSSYFGKTTAQYYQEDANETA